MSPYFKLGKALAEAVAGLSEVKNQDRLYFPGEITEEIGLARNAINQLKKRGCKFFGQKTKIRWVNEFLEQEAAAIPIGHEPGAALSHLSEHK